MESTRYNIPGFKEEKKYTRKFVIINWCAIYLGLATLISGYFHPEKVLFLNLSGIIYPFTFAILVAITLTRIIQQRILSKTGLLTLIITLCMLSRVFAISFSTSRGEHSLKVASYNVGYFNREAADKGTESDIAGWVNYENPDIICIQEYLHFFTATNILETLYPYKYEGFFSKNYLGHRGSIILSKYPIIDGEKKNFHIAEATYLRARILTPYDTINVVNVNFETSAVIQVSDSLDALSRWRRIVSEEYESLIRTNLEIPDQCDTICRMIDSLRGPVIVCTNLNDIPFSYAYRKIKGPRTDAFSASGNGFGYSLRSYFRPVRTDYILYSEHLQSVEYKSPQEKWSSHKPVVSILKKNPGNPIFIAFPFLKQHTWLHVSFWCALFIIFYTYIGYALVLWLLVWIKERIFYPYDPRMPENLPEVTVMVTAYNEEKLVEQKMQNLNNLDYPKDKLKILWITDGTTDSTVELLHQYDNVRVSHLNERLGKTAAYNRGIKLIASPITVFTDARSLINTQAIKEIVRMMDSPQIGCVACKKKIIKKDNGKSISNEGIYWRYESKLKELDWRLNSAIGADGALFAIRTSLFQEMSYNTIIDDFVVSLKVAESGYKIAYTSKAYAEKTPSTDLTNAKKREQRVAAGGLQSIWKLVKLLNIMKYKTLSFQYISHRVLRWAVAPILIFALLPLNIALVSFCPITPYIILLALQVVFYLVVALGYYMYRKGRRVSLLFIPCYFIFTNLNILRGYLYLIKNWNKGTWEKLERELEEIGQ